MEPAEWIAGPQPPTLHMAELQHSYLSEAQVAEQLGMSVSTLRRLIDDGEFPEGIALSDRNVRWYAKDVDCFVWWKMRGKKQAEQGKKQVSRE